MSIDDLQHGAQTLRDSALHSLAQLTPSPETMQQAHTVLQQFGSLLHGLLLAAWQDLLSAIGASRPLASALAGWWHQMNHETTAMLMRAASQWWAVPSVQHVLWACAALVVLLLLPRKARRPAPVARSAARRRRSGAWHGAALGAGAGAAAMAFAQSTTHHDDDNLGDDAHPGYHSDFFATGETLSHSATGCAINPANGLPMVGGDCSGVDVMGNLYGTDLSDSFSTSWSHDSFDSGSDSWSSSNDSWSSSDSWSTSSSSWD